MKKSPLYRIVEAVTAVMGPKWIFKLEREALRSYLERHAEKQNRTPPAYIGKKHTVTLRTINGHPCYLISPKEGAGSTAAPAGKKAVLFIHGGGYVFEAHWIHWRAVSRIVGTLGIPVWFPVYPLLPRHEIPRALRFLVHVYTHMLTQYPPEGIVVLGDSAGAALSLSLCHHIAGEAAPTGDKPLPMPASLILLSPIAMVERDKAVLEAMCRAEPKDVMLSMKFIYSIIEIFHIEADKTPACYMPMSGDFSRFPPMHIFSGMFECGFAQVEAFVKRLAAAGISADFHAGPQMAHIWPYLPFAPECKKALATIIDIIRGRDR